MAQQLLYIIKYSESIILSYAHIQLDRSSTNITTALMDAGAY